jgi:hypothetical protein
MTPDDARSLLKIWGHATDIVFGKEELMEETKQLLKKTYDTVSGIPLDLVPQPLHTSDPVTGRLCQIDTYAAQFQAYERSIAETIRVKAWVDEILLKQPRIVYDVVRLRYQENMIWGDMEKQLNMANSTLRSYERVAVHGIIEKAGTLRPNWYLLSS